MTMKMKNRSHRYDINRPRPRHGHEYTKHKLLLSILMVICIKKHLQATFEAQFIKELSNTEAELKKRITYKKAYFFFISNDVNALI